MKKLLILGAILGAFILTGCNEKTYTVEEFTANKELRDEYRQKCQNGEIDGDSLNCQNSRKAMVLTNKVSNASWD